MKRINLYIFLVSLLTSSLALADVASSNINNISSGENTNNSLPTISSITNQVGIAYEGRSSYADGYAFFNQLLNNTVFYELRAYYIYNYISSSRVISGVTPSNQDNVDGTGVVGILGYNIPLNSNVTFMPFIRLQLLTNTVSAYEDSFGNKINSVNYSALLGGKLSMKVNDVFSIYAQFYGGYQRSRLDGEGVFDTHNDPQINALTSTLEFGLPYKITQSWSITPYMQFSTTDNNPNHAASKAPYSSSKLTSTGNVYALKLAYKF